MFFKELDEQETQAYVQWARDHFESDVEANPVWHPVIRAEWARLQAEQDHITATLASLNA